MEKQKKILWLNNNRQLFAISIFVLAILVHLPYLAPGGPAIKYPWPLKIVIDEGTVLYDSFRITSGEVMYRDFFQFQGPVFYYIYAGLFAITGPSLTAARALNLLITAFTAMLIGSLIARNLGMLAGAGAAAVHACLLVPMWPYAYPHWLAESFSFLGIYFLMISRFRARFEWIGGAFLGLSVFTIQSIGLPILGACMAVLAMSGIIHRGWKDTCARPLRVLGGAMLSISPFILYLSVVGGFDQMWYAMFEWVFKHYPEGQTDIAGYGYGAFVNSDIINHSRVNQPWRYFAVIGLRLVEVLPLFSVLGAIALIIQAFIKGGRQLLNNSYLLIGAASIAGTSPLLLGITRADLTHIAFIGSFGLCGASIFFSLLVHWKPRFRFPIIIAWIIIGILTVTNLGAKTVMTYQPSRNMLDWKGEILKHAIPRWIDANVSPHERIVVSDMAGLQYLYIRRSAVGFTFIPVNVPKYFSDEQWQKLGRQILIILPPVIEMSEKQWLQVTNRTPELTQHYQRNNHFLLRKGFVPHKSRPEKHIFK
ncbi:MAG: hypothetical protein FJ123_19570 [Deltaproteobacteria bacterium]|nr:hypothetical protein [Deltaproteobacteria bacterium]